MESKMVSRKLTDGSKVYSVQIRDEKLGDITYIDCIDENSAYCLKMSIESCAIDFSIWC